MATYLNRAGFIADNRETELVEVVRKGTFNNWHPFWEIGV